MKLLNFDLRKLQKIEFDILCDFAAYCRDNGLRYYLIGGALLGAARYGRFIPWDNDIDVAMPREDYDRLKQCYHSEKYFLQNFESDSKFARSIQKIRLNGTRIVEFATKGIDMHHGIYIDIFPIDYVDDIAPEVLSSRAKKIRRLMSLNAIIAGYKSDRYNWLRFIIRKLCPYSNRQIEDKLFQLCTMENNSSRNYSILWLHNYTWNKQIHESAVFGDGSICMFEGRQFIAPAKADEFLKKVFGEDYIREPPKEKQIMPHRYINVNFEENK